MPYTALRRKSSTLAAFFMLFGLVFSMTGILYAMVGKVTRFSDPQVILISCTLVGVGLLLIFASLNIASMNRSCGRSTSFIAGMFFSLLGILIVVTSYPEKWLYPTVAYAFISYSLGIFLIIINLFVNCFSLFHLAPECTGSDVTSSSETITGPEKTGVMDSSVMAAFAVIMVASMLPDYSRPSLHNEDAGINMSVISVPQDNPTENTNENTGAVSDDA